MGIKTDRDPGACLPLTSAMFHVLVALAGGDLHGYAIVKDVRARTGGKVELGTGTLYGIIKRLLADGLATESRARVSADSDDPRRRYYKLTPFGRKVVMAETERLEAMISSARTALRPRTAQQ